MYIEVRPLEGIFFEQKSIKIAVDRQGNVKSQMGQPDSIYDNSYYYFDSELRVDFDENGYVEYIEFLGGIDGMLQPVIYGMKAFECQADELYHSLIMNDGDIVDNENGYSYTFMNISVGLYRENIPQDIEELICDMKADGIEIEGNENLELEKKMAYHWSTLGIGRKDYYSKKKGISHGK